ncbi:MULTISPECIES: L-piperidine-6-carboxylate dehydrogenase [Pseudomonas syringae group]|uniref:aldehyde dehydrogenase (NAD(+)) n=3 Tax=Pseudomonas syringae group genomosp. 3 TaxID=251701 RepID=Q885E4_PSESM|nr:MULTISPECIES: aldehyde dehydrogenase family protein [Pseudomonas syringae group]KPC07306.1 Piperideine-6-carboxylate dehydrogenase [Pseudomonas amygdali pv. lachrymans]AAO55409.1 piperideine-6-carboxylate dehydrogenase [Pseudomonas syringae pv. tomato str. DC3000]EGH97563.1 piperideine-6-carboxylate dehydrogenase [Pseudomonas amygdali pv. lachrymans str. M302278]KKI26737.1 aldehyde dehydrogenase [Pseudomonas syringae pv. persicae]KPB96042.1 Piperideine-6-carboxylate dehydrogenase [Pseudomon
MVAELLARLGVANSAHTQGDYPVYTPIDGSQIASVTLENEAQVVARIDSAHSAFLKWRTVPAPRRGELVRIFGEVLREHKADLGELVSVEAGKITQEGLGEVQEMIDICDFAVGLSRQLYGLTIASERPGHHMRETWHPLGVVGVISAFNFPVAVWAWNTTLALVCGNPVIWKPSEKTPLTALACQALFDKALTIFGDAPAALAQLVIGDRDAGEALVDDPRVPLISATGSTRMGREVGPRVAARFGRTILELGGNNAMILAPSADLDLAVRGILFSAVGTAGQRCTTLRRLIVHRSIKDEVVACVKAAYAKVRVGDPREGNLIGPLIDQQAFSAMQNALTKARDEGGQVFGGERQLQDKYPNGYYVTPAIAEMPGQTEVVRHETFAPILYVLAYDDFEEALRLNNEVPQGLSSCIFTTDLREAEAFQSAAGSDCGIANVNIGTSGAEIGGAFGGEKETGGGRESGSDSWRAYMRRQTNTVNYSRELPLAQGIVFD